MKHMCIPERNSLACKVCGQPCVYPVTSSADTSPTPYVKRCPQCKLLYFDGGHDPQTCDGKGAWPGSAFSRAVLETAAPNVMSIREAGTIVVHDDRPFVRCARCSHKPRAPGELDCVDCLRDAVLE